MWRGGGSIEGWEVSVTSICPRSSFNHNPKYSHRPISASPAVFAFLILTNLIAWFHVQAHPLCVGKYMFIFMLVYVWRQQPEINIRCLCLSLFTLLWEPRFSHCVWTLSAQLGWLANEFSESVYLFSPSSLLSQGWGSRCKLLYPAFQHGCRGSKSRTSHVSSLPTRTSPTTWSMLSILKSCNCASIIYYAKGDGKLLNSKP